MKQPIRILYVLNDVGGGASLGIYEMLRGLPRERILPFAVVPAASPQALAKIAPLFADLRIVPLPWWNVRRDLGLARRLVIALSGRLRGGSMSRSTVAVEGVIREWNIDLVHSGTSLTLSGALAARKAGVPHIWHIKESVGRAGRVQFPLADSELVGFMSGHSACVVAMSEFIASPFRQNGCTNLEVVPDGVDLSAYLGGSSRNLRQRLNVKPEGQLVGMVASLSSTWKKHDVFIRMSASLAPQEPHTRFVLIGPQPQAKRWPHDTAGRYFAGLKELAERNGLTGVLEFIDFVPDPPDIMRSLDVLVHTCSEEPFGRIAIEAMAAGTPVVGPRAGGIAESVTDEQTGLLVAPDDPDAFAVATRRLLRDPALRERLGQAARQSAAGRFSIAEHARRLSSIYEKALPGK